MQWFSHILDVFTWKIRQKFYDFYILWIKTNVAYTRLEVIARMKYCTTTTASNWLVTLYYKLPPAVSSSSKHGRWQSSLSLCSISMVWILWPPAGGGHVFTNHAIGSHGVEEYSHVKAYGEVPSKWVTFLSKILRHGSYFDQKSLEEGPISQKLQNTCKISRFWGRDKNLRKWSWFAKVSKKKKKKIVKSAAFLSLQKNP